MNTPLPYDTETALKDTHKDIHGGITPNSPKLNTTCEQGYIVAYASYRALERKELQLHQQHNVEQKETRLERNIHCDSNYMKV